ncbi:hypothetical protein BJF77_00685 [Kocuria sp. CNJ-770]|nr:hypothetical protein ABL57_11395 [Kocuria sp. SM24M-10]OLT10319.1 hypothetical protein BJF77_00685 [Kocuria sp. CNJ-770]
MSVPPKETPVSNPYPDRPGQPSGPPSYNASGGDQYGGGRPAAAPPELGRLLTLTLASAGLYLLSQLVSLFTSFSGDQTAVLEESGLSADQIASLQGTATITSIVLIVVAMALYALIYVFLKKGKNWARILGIVLGIISVVSTVLGLLVGGMAIAGLGIVSLILAIAFVVVNVLWLVTAFKAPIKQWFARPHMA